MANIPKLAIQSICFNIYNSKYDVISIIFLLISKKSLQYNTNSEKDLSLERIEELQNNPYYIDTKELEQQLKAKQLLFETIPY